MKSLYFCVVAALAFGLSVSCFAAEKPKVGEAAPEFSLKDQDGKTVSLADYKGKIVVLEWFNEECPFVEKYYSQGHMNKLAANYAEKDVARVLINTTKGKSGSTNKAVAGRWNITRPILDDSKGDVARQYAATNTPQMFIINKGTLVYNGAIDNRPSTETSDIEGSKNFVAQALDEVLAGKTVSEPETKPYGCSVKYAE